MLDFKSFEPLSLHADRDIKARDFLLKHHVNGALFGQPLVVGFLELLEGAHHLGMRHHRIGRMPALVSSPVLVSISISFSFVMDGCCRPRAAARRVALRRIGKSGKISAGRRYRHRQLRSASGCGLKLVRGRDIDRLTVQQTREATMATMEELPFTIEEWDAEGLHRLQIVARASNPAVGWAAYRDTVAMA